MYLNLECLYVVGKGSVRVEEQTSTTMKQVGVVLRKVASKYLS